MTVLFDYISSSSNYLYGCAVNSVKNHISPAKLDEAEMPFSVAAGMFGAELLHSLVRKTSEEEGFTKELCIASIFMGVAGWLFYINGLKRPYVKREIESIVQKSQSHEKSLLLLRTSLDFTGATSSHSNLSRIKKLSESHSVEVVTKKEIGKVLTKKYDIIIVQAHGNEAEISLSHDFSLSKTSKQALSWLNSLTKTGSIIAIEACEAGKGEDNIAKEISLSCPQARVFASSAPVENFSGIKYDDSGCPEFTSNKQNTTRLFKAGMNLSH